MTKREELTNALSAFQAAWDSAMGELDELTSIPEAELDPNNEDRIAQLNEDLCSVAEWMQATNSAISHLDKETNNVSD